MTKAMLLALAGLIGFAATAAAESRPHEDKPISLVVPSSAAAASSAARSRSVRRIPIHDATLGGPDR